MSTETIQNLDCDVAIIGGGPAGSTVGTMLKKYNPQLSVAILEREAFPRDHVGESQLPFLSRILHEMEVWDKVEAAGFPIKIGATYRWGKSDQLWDFEFVNNGQFLPSPRPGKFVGQRQETAFQVDRAVYDKILLDHAGAMGCSVFEQTKVVKVNAEEDSVSRLTAACPEGKIEVNARFYVDCSGHTGVLRRAMGVEVESPTNLRNIAIWDYWQNAEWAVSVGVEGTRVQVLSLGYGWIWFIPLGPTRTSIGLIVPADYYRDSGLDPETLYGRAIDSDPVIRALTAKASREDNLQTTKDWSFLASRLSGKNWFLAGESAGFADPILAAGMTLAHKGAREVAYSILELDRDRYDRNWILDRYSQSHRRDILQHIRFADFWYTQNGLFTDLKDFARSIAGDAGLSMTSEEAWRWIGTGGFIDSDASSVNVGGYALLAAKKISADFLQEEVNYRIFGKTHFRFDSSGAEEDYGVLLADGRIERHKVYRRDGKSVPRVGACGWLIDLLDVERTAVEIMSAADAVRNSGRLPQEVAATFPRTVIEILEAMVIDGWVHAREQAGAVGWPSFSITYERFIHKNNDIAQRI